MARQFIPYSILHQDHGETLAPNGHFVDIVTVTFQSPSGVTSTVKVPERQYAPEVVERLIQDKLYNIEQVHAMGDSPVDPTTFTTG